MKKDTIRHVIFDFDGTIADSFNVSIELFNQSAEKYNFNKIREEEFEYLRSLSIFERCKALNVSLLQIPRIGAELNENYYQAIKSIQVFMGIKELIVDLQQQGLHLSILSSNSIGNIKEFLKSNDLDVFDHIYSAKNLFGKGKAINRFMKKHHLSHDELIYIGDEHRDIVASKENNIKVIAVTWGYDSFTALTAAKPNYIVDNPSEIADIVGMAKIQTI